MAVGCGGGSGEAALHRQREGTVELDSVRFVATARWLVRCECDVASLAAVWRQFDSAAVVFKGCSTRCLSGERFCKPLRR